MMLPWPRNPQLGDLMAGLGMRLKTRSKSKLLADGPRDSSVRILRWFLKLKAIAHLLDSVPFVFHRLFIGCGPVFVWPIFRDGCTLESPIRCSVPVRECLQLMPLLTMKRFQATLVKVISYLCC